jgi:hypothetical protein
MSEGSSPIGLLKLRSAFLFQPLVVALAYLLVLPPADWMTGGRQFQAKADVTSVPVYQCNSPNTPVNTIFNQSKLCAGVIDLGINDQFQLESDAITAYLLVHGQPLSEYASIYSTGRTDLRSQIRANMLAILLGIIARAPKAATGDYSGLSQHEINLYKWFAKAVQQNELSLYQYAVQDRNEYIANACNWSPDADVASAYGLVYNTADFCDNSIGAVTGAQAPVPSLSYFLASAYKNSNYGQGVNTPGGAQVVANTGAGVTGAVLGGLAVVDITASLAGLVTNIAADLTIPEIFAGIFPYAVYGLSISLGALGAIALPLLMIAVGIMMVINLVNYQKQLNDIDGSGNAIDTGLANAQSQYANLSSFTGDSLSMLKLTATLAAYTLPENASTVTLPTHLSSDKGFFITGPSGPATTATQFTYQGCDGNAWTATTHNGWWVQTSTQNGMQVDSFTGDICILSSTGDGTGVKRQIGLRGNSYIVTLLIPPGVASACPPDPNTGLTGGSLAGCASWVTNTFQYLDSNNNLYQNQIDAGPLFLTPSTFSFYQKLAGAGFQIDAAEGTISVVGTVPAGFSFTPGANSTATITYLGNISPGTYTMTLQAQSIVGVQTQVLTLQVVANPLTFTSPDILSFMIGVPASFTARVSGAGPITLGAGLPGAVGATPGQVPAGMTFKDNGDGTGTLSGTPALNAAGCNGVASRGPLTPGGCGFNATQTSTNFGLLQPVTVTINPPPPAQYSGATSASFVQGVPSSFIFLSSGALTHVSWNATGLPTGATFADNGDGTATLAGTSLDLAGTYPFTVSYQTYGVPGSQTINFVLSVLGFPAFTSQNYYTCTLPGGSGTTSCNFNITTNQGINQGAKLNMIGALPPGLTFNANATPSGPELTGSITGTIGPGAGGFYPLTLSASTAQGVTTQIQNFALRVHEPPTFTNQSTTVFNMGAPNSFNVGVRGFPMTPEGSGPGTIPNSTGMALTIDGSTALPSWLHFTPASTAGVNSGNAILSGTPPGAGTFPFRIDAFNNVGSVVTQNFTLEVVGRGAMSVASEITGGSGESGAGQFGSSVGLSADGGTAVIGAPNDNGGFGAGFIFAGSAGSPWQQRADLNALLLTNNSTTATQMVGTAVAVSGDGHTALFGAPGYNIGTGAAWIFGNGATGNWTQLQDPLTNSSGPFGGHQGASVALSGDGSVALLGAPQSNFDGGMVYIYTRAGGAYSIFETLSEADLPQAQFGTAVAITPDGNTIIVGGPVQAGGKAWIYTRSSPNASWFLNTEIGGGGESGSGQFGASVAISADGNTAIVGGPGDNNNTGAFWVLTRNGNSWSQQGNKLTVSDATGAAKVGSSVALSADGNTALIGGPADDTQSGGGSIGATWVFRRQNGAWVQQRGKMIGSGAVGLAQQGSAVALSADGNSGLTSGPLDTAGFPVPVNGAGAVWPLGSAQVNVTLSHLTALTAGQSGSYTIGLTNAGSINTSGGIFWTASVPSNLSVTGFTGPAGWSCNTTSPGCSTANGLIPGAGAQFTMNVSAVGAGGFTTTVTATTQELNTDNSSASDSSSVTKGTPVVTWGPIAPITYGSALGTGQLNATASVPGSFVYTPPVGMVLPVGNNQTLSVAFTPADLVNYSSVTATNSINVLPGAGGSGSPNLVLTSKLTRGTGNVVVLTLTLANSGGAAAQSVTLTTAKIGTTSGTPLPQLLGAIAAGSSTQTTVTFPATVGASGAGGVLSLAGSYTGGTFSNGARIILP